MSNNTNPYELPWWTPAGMVKKKTEEWNEPAKAFVSIAQSMKELVPWMKFVLGSTGFVMLVSGALGLKMFFGG